MSTLKELTSYLESIAPLHYQESYDNSGLIVGDESVELTGVLISLDITEDVLDEAISLKCNTVISHHPLIFRGIKKIGFRHYVDRTLIKAIKNDLNIYALHTNLDNILKRGVNSKIADKLNLVSRELLTEDIHFSHDEIPKGAGIIGTLRSPLGEEEFLSFLKEEMNTPLIRHTTFLHNQINRVAICGGSGSFLLREAIKKSADVFVSGDFKYHDFFEANKEILIADIGHYESEQFTIELIFELITDKFINFAAHCTNLSTNPIHYY